MREGTSFDGFESIFYLEDVAIRAVMGLASCWEMKGW